MLASVRNVSLAGLALALMVGACGPAGRGDGNGDRPDAAPVIDDGCPGPATTTLSGVVTTPNGLDPVPGATVYVARSLTPRRERVSCTLCTAPAIDAIVATRTAVDGTFQLGPIPRPEGAQNGDTIQLVVEKSGFRQVTTFTMDAWCEAREVPAEATRLPSDNDGDDLVPRIAVATGDYDRMECVLYGMGLRQAAVDLYEGDLFAAGPEAFSELISDGELMQRYDLIIVNCTSNVFEDLLDDAQVRANVENYVRAGGRLYATDWSYDYIEQIPSWSDVIDFGPGASGAAPEPRDGAEIGHANLEPQATLHDAELIAWLRAVEAASGDSILAEDDTVHLTHFIQDWVMQREVPPVNTSKVWVTAQVSGSGLSGDLPLTTSFDVDQCGRVVYSSYHTAGGEACSTPLLPQERILEYLIFHAADCIAID